MEFSLFMEGYVNRLERQREMTTAAGWLTARLGRAKRIPPLHRILRSDKPHLLSPEEAEKHRKRHEALTKRLAPDAKATEEQLQRFIKEENRKFAERMKARRMAFDEDGNELGPDEPPPEKDD